MKNYDNFDLYDIVQKRNDVIDLKHNLQDYVQRLRKHENNLAIKEMGALKGGGFFSGITSVISPFIRNIIKILSPVIGILPGGGNILKILENLNTISSKIGQLEKTFESWEKNTKLNNVLFDKFKKICFLLNNFIKVFVSEKMELDPNMIEMAQIMQEINSLKSYMKALKKQGEKTFNKVKELSEMDPKKMAQRLIELELKLVKFIKGKDLKKEIEKFKNLATDPKAILSEVIKMAIFCLPLPGMALIPKIQMITQDILRFEEILMGILDTISDIIFSQSICPTGSTYLDDDAGSCKFIGDELYDGAIELKTLILLPLVESEKGKDIVRSLDPHYQSIRPGNIKDGDDILKLLINLLIRFIRYGKTREIIKLLPTPDALSKFNSLKKMLIKFEEFPYKWPMGIKVQDYIFDILKGFIDQDEDMQQFFAKIANQLSGSPQNLESLIQMLLDSQGIKKTERLENGGGKKSKKKSSRKRIKGKKMGKYTRKH